MIELNNNFYQPTLGSTKLQQVQEAKKPDSDSAIKEASEQFESLFVDMMLRSMRKATQKSGLLDSHATQTYEQLFDQEIAKNLSQSRVFGIAEVIERQLQYIERPGQKNQLAFTTASKIGLYLEPDEAVSNEADGSKMSDSIANQREN
tara:strand:- start:758 stop:1201 length:444 start_codon:yes stop_codon:yes gene_type:complete